MCTTNIIEHKELQRQYSSFINCIPNNFYISSLCEKPRISIFNQNNHASETLHLPLTISSIQKLKEIAIVSPFGLGTKTVYNDRIRQSLELNSTQFHIENFDTSSTKNPYLEKIRKCLSPHIDYITCKPYKLLLYEKGSFFKSHVDTPLNKNQFGSLIISIPFEEQSEGGELYLYFNDQRIKWKAQHNKCQLIAFYSDIQHEVKPITKGHRIVITFNLFIPNNIQNVQFEKAMTDQNKYGSYRSISDYFYSIPTQKPPAPKVLKKILFDIISKSKYGQKLPDEIIWVIVEFGTDEIINCIQNLLEDEAFHKEDHENAIFIILSHRYHGKYINPMNLKGNDMFLYNTFKEYFGLYLTRVVIASVIGKWSDEIADIEGNEEEYYASGIIDEWDEKDDKTEWKIHQPYLPRILRKKLSWICDFVVLYNNKKQTLKDAKFVNGGEQYYGNVGTYDLENQYHCTALLLTKHDPTVVVDGLEQNKSCFQWIYDYKWEIVFAILAVIIVYNYDYGNI